MSSLQGNDIWKFPLMRSIEMGIVIAEADILDELSLERILGKILIFSYCYQNRIRIDV